MSIMSDIHKLYKLWCKETKRNGAILVGGSIRQFFDWLEADGYKLIKNEHKTTKKD